MKNKKTYVVTAYKFGERNNHSYVVGVFNKKHAAISAADSHSEFRGYKYLCSVEVCDMNFFDNQSDTYSEEIYMVNIQTALP